MKNVPVTIIQNKKHPKIQKHQPESFIIHPMMNPDTTTLCFKGYEHVPGSTARG